MFDSKTSLEKVHIKNFLSLRDVELPLKPLTVLVGPNASGKSNVLNALNLLNMLMIAENVPPVEVISDSLWAGGARRITFQLQAKVRETPTEYRLEIEEASDNPFASEELSVNGIPVIKVQSGKGNVWDENRKNQTTYTSNRLALKSAGDYGNKPVTGELTAFVKGWQFYNFQPDLIRRALLVEEFTPEEFKTFRESPKLDANGLALSAVLPYWHQHRGELFNNVSASLAASTNISLDYCSIDSGNHLCLLEGYEKPIPLARASDGTLRLVAYYILLNQPELPPLIAIEEPERNLHPNALADIAEVLEQIAKRTQVIITTHSSQLLDEFKAQNLSDSLGVLLLRNLPGRGTEVINVADIRSERAAVDGWIADFGVGSAIFHSELLQDLMEDSA